MIRQVLLVLLLLGFAVAAESAQGSPLMLEGDVVRENGSPVAGVMIGAIEITPWYMMLGGPIADREIAKTVTDRTGHFTLQIPQGTNIRGLILVAAGEGVKRFKTKDGDVGLMGTSVPLRK